MKPRDTSLRRLPAFLAGLTLFLFPSMVLASASLASLLIPFSQNVKPG